MKRKSHLTKVLIVWIIILAFAVGEPDWWRHVSIVCFSYYFGFILNLFRRMYESENFLTRMFFGYTDMPLIVGSLIIVLSFFVRKLDPDANVYGLYLCATVGGVATLIARIKSGTVANK